MKRVLITGSNGFIGSHTCRFLKSKGFHVIGLGRSPVSKTEYVEDYVQCDLSEKDAFKKLKGIGADAVLHLAADMRKAPYEKEILHHNCMGTQVLLEWCGEQKNSPFIQLSSLPVIGAPKQLPVTEHHSIHPPTFYHATKVMQEMQAQYAMEKYGIRTISLRICSPIGVGMNEKTIFATFVRNAVQGKELIIYGNGTRKQTYIPVVDIARAMYACLLTTQAKGVFNLGSDIFLSNIELATKCIEVLGSSSDIVFNGEPDPADNLRWDIDMDKFIREIGYRPETPIESVILEYGSTIQR